VLTVKATSTFASQFYPMSYFTKKLYNNQAGFAEFHFNGLDTIYGRKFHVTVLCDSCQHVHFTMKESRGGWEIINAPQPPQWIVSFENDLSRSIIEYLAQSMAPHQPIR
jgi:hypothetical protein